MSRVLSLSPVLESGDGKGWGEIDDAAIASAHTYTTHRTAHRGRDRCGLCFVQMQRGTCRRDRSGHRQPVVTVGSSRGSGLQRPWGPPPYLSLPPLLPGTRKVAKQGAAEGMFAGFNLQHPGNKTVKMRTWYLDIESPRNKTVS